MGKVVGPPIPEDVVQWTAKQHVFFVASAPLSASNRVNVSPKSAKEFRVLDESRVAYLDYSGSGAETAAHLLENGRLTIMFVALNGSPKIVRFYGKGRLVLPDALFDGTSKRADLRAAFGLADRSAWPADIGARCIVVLDVERVSSSCGYSIPIFEHVRDRKTLQESFLKQGNPKGYRETKNSFSIDGLRSFTQLERKEVPVSRWNDNGYWLSSYAADASLGAELRRLWLRACMAYASGLHGAWRDAAMALAGAVVASALLRLRSSRATAGRPAA